MANTFKFGNGNWAVKEDYALAYNDENGNFKPLPFDFTRASSATRVNKNGLIETVPSGKPRIDFTDNTSGHLLLEPSRTNNVTYSEDFTQSSYWLVSSMTVTSDDTTSPYGTQTADKIEATGAGSVRTSSYTGTDGYAFSIFVKKGNSTYVTLRAFGFTTSIIVGFNLDTLTAQTGGVIEDYGNDWYRLSISKDISSDADKSGFFYIYLPDVLGQTTSVSGNYAYFFGTQLEDADYPTSYIPTSGLTETRSAEVANGAGNSTVFNISEGVLYAEMAALANDGTIRRIAIPNTGVTGLHRIELSSTDNKVFGVTYVSPSNQAAISHTLTDVTTTFKIAYKFKANDFALWVNGVEVGTDSSGSVPTGLVKINFDNGSGGNDFYGKVKDLRVYDTALSDSELQALTS
jgi:hypothetical protein